MSASPHLPAGGAAAASDRHTPAAPYYVAIPLRLLQALRDTPLAVGVYALIARTFRATRAPVPLSPADVMRYDPSLSDSAAHRALDRLRELGFLAVAPERSRRNAFTPTWGPVAGALRAWDLDAPGLACPRHIATVRLPQDLLDSFLGRLEPHDRRGAHVARYVTAPLLALADVGAYALALAGYPAQSAALAQLGLLADGQPRPVPPLEDVLALASQRRLFEAGSPVTLTSAGWLRLGLLAAPLAPSGRPLIFVPADRIGERGGLPGGDRIGSPAPADACVSASQRPRGRSAPPPAGSHGISCGEGSEKTTTPPVRQSRWGGGELTSPGTGGAAAGARHDRQEDAESETAARLRQIGVRREVAGALAGRPLAQVERVIAEARGRAGVRDVAAWVVSALRALPAEEPGAPAQKVSDLAILTHPELSNGERLRWLSRFRGADPAERPAVLARFLAEHPGRLG